MKGKGEKERYPHLKAESHRIARRDKKAFLRDQCKETEKTIKWERLEISSRKPDTKGTFHADGQKWYEPNRNGMNLIEAEEIKRWQEYTEELYKKVLNDLYNQDGVITHLEPDNLE